MKLKNKKNFVVIFIPKIKNKIEYKGEYQKIIDEDSSLWRRDNILIQMTQLHPSCKGHFMLPDRNLVNEIINNVDEIFPELYSENFPKSLDIPKFYRYLNKPGLFEGLRATVQAKKYINQYIKNNKINKKIITIIIRQYGYDKARNSNLKEWSKFVDYLLNNNYHPVIVPDTDNAFGEDLPFEKKYIFSDCCWNIQLRMALYELSTLNFSSPGGAGVIMQFNPLVKCIFMNMNPKGSFITTPEAMKRDFGIEMGEQFKYLQPYQYLSFKSETFENIKYEFLKFENKFI